MCFLSKPTLAFPRGKFLRSWVVPLAILGLVILLASCKTSTEASGVAKDLGSTSSDLANYYSDLAAQITETIELSELDFRVNQNAFGDSDRATLNDIKSEISKRAGLAQSLSALASTYGTLAGSTSPTAASTAASKLGTELQTDLKTLKVLPASSKTGAAATETAAGAAIPTAMSEAATILTDFIQTRELKNGAKAIQKCVEGLDQLYTTESPRYEALSTARIQLAERLAKDLVDQDQVELSPVILPALQPFGFAPKMGSPKGWYADVAKDEINQQAADQITSYVQKTQAIYKSLLKEDAELTAVITGKKASASKTP